MPLLWCFFVRADLVDGGGLIGISAIQGPFQTWRSRCARFIRALVTPLSPEKNGAAAIVHVNLEPRRKPISAAPGALCLNTDRVPGTYAFAGREVGTFPGSHEYACKALLASTTIEVDVVT